ncbi:MAG: hypothetical protein M3471_07510, partial [Actinomycetota bacterium]|nr:hypothetical protein [Actinomycetota bacterium]
LTFAGAGPDGVGDFLLTLARIALGGLVISAAYTAVSLAAASLTDRRPVASAGVILVLLISGVSTAVLVASGADERLFLLNLLAVPFELVQRIYGEVGDIEVSTLELVAANLAWTIGAGALLRSRYQRLRVTR